MLLNILSWSITNTQNLNINEDKTCVEWEGFKLFYIFETYTPSQDWHWNSVKEDQKGKKEEALKRQKNFGPHVLLKEIEIDDTVFWIP